MVSSLRDEALYNKNWNNHEEKVCLLLASKPNLRILEAFQVVQSLQIVKYLVIHKSQPKYSSEGNGFKIRRYANEKYIDY